MTQKRKDSYSHVLKYTGIFGGVQGLGIVMGLLRGKIVAQLLGTAGMGLASLFNTAVTFISQATNLGLSFSAVNQISEAYDKGDTATMGRMVRVIRIWSLLTALLGMAVCVALGPLLARYAFHQSGLWLHFILLSPAVGLLAITGGETAILKGTRQLKSLASIQVGNVFAALLTAIPLYYFLGQRGIVPVIVTASLVAMVLTVRHSLRLFPLSLHNFADGLGQGRQMVRLGVAFVLAGIMGSGAEMLVRAYLNVAGGLSIVGLYNAGFMITVTYAGMVFSAMETDYFPRLSAIATQRRPMCQTVNEQIEVSLLITSPLLCLLIVAMPFVIPLLFASEFRPVVTMAQVAVFSMYLKSMTLPVSYLTLARGDSLAYFATEALYDVLLVLLMMAGFHFWGLWGTGAALSLSYLADGIIVLAYTRWRYGYRPSRAVIRYALVQLPIGIAAYLAATHSTSALTYWSLGLLCCAASASVSVAVLRKKTTLWSNLKARIAHRHSQEK